MAVAVVFKASFALAKFQCGGRKAGFSSTTTCTDTPQGRLQIVRNNFSDKADKLLITCII